MKRHILTTAVLGGLLAMAAVAASQEEPAAEVIESRGARVAVEPRLETYPAAPERAIVQSTPAAQPRTTTAGRSNLPGYGTGISFVQGSSLPVEHEYQIRLRSAAREHEARVQALVREWQAAEDDEARSKTEGVLHKALGEAFDARMAQHEKQVEELEARVKQLREQIDRRREKQDDIIDFRLQELLREAQGLGWGGEPVGSSGNPFLRGAAAPITSPGPAQIAPRRSR